LDPQANGAPRVEDLAVADEEDADEAADEEFDDGRL